MGNKVNHPDHYQNIAGVEAIDILNDVVKDLPGKQAAMLWNAMKYLFRFQKKNGVEDLKKARNYLDYLIDDIEAVSEKCPEFLSDTWHSNEYDNMAIFAKSKEPNGMPSKLTFDTAYAAEEFRSVFYNMLSEGYDEFSIADVALEMKFKTSKGNKWNKWDDLVNWKKVHDSFTIEQVGDKYELIFNYKDISKTQTNIEIDKCTCVTYKSKISGHAEVYHSEHMYAGTCTEIIFTSDLCRDMFIANFFNKLKSEDYKPYSIREILSATNSYIIPGKTDEFEIKMPWKDIFSRFILFKEGNEYALEFVYKDGVLDQIEASQPTNDAHILCKSTVWGSADVYYSTELLKGTCTKILFNDIDARNTFALKFFKYLRYENSRFSIREILDDCKYLWGEDDYNLSINVPWKDIFKGFYMGEEGGKYVLEFIYKKDTEDDSEPLLGEE